MHWNSYWVHAANQRNFPAKCTIPRLLAAFNPISRRWISNVKLEFKGTPKIRRLSIKSEVTITGSSCPKPAYHHRLVCVKPRMPFQTPRFDCCQIQIQGDHYLRMRKRSKNEYIDCSTIRIAYNMVSNWSSSVEYNIHNNALQCDTPKTHCDTLDCIIQTLKHCNATPPKTQKTEVLTAPSKRTCCLLSLRNSDNTDKNCPPTLVDLSLYNRPRWLTLSNTAEKLNWASLASVQSNL